MSSQSRDQIGYVFIGPLNSHTGTAGICVMVVMGTARTAFQIIQANEQFHFQSSQVIHLLSDIFEVKLTWCANGSLPLTNLHP